MSRPLPPRLPILNPPCPICEKTTKWGFGSYDCPDCGIEWDDDGANPRWMNADAAQCRSVYTTKDVYNAFIDITEKGTAYRCLREDGHLDGKHVNPAAGTYWITGDPEVTEVAS